MKITRQYTLKLTLAGGGGKKVRKGRKGKNVARLPRPTTVHFRSWTPSEFLVQVWNRSLKL